MELKEVKKASELKIDPRLQSVIPPMRAEDYTKLYSSLKNGKQEVPVDLMADGTTIIDGHNRKSILQELDREVECRIHPEVKTTEQAMALSETINTARRHLNTFQKIEFRYKVIQGSIDPRKRRTQGLDEEIAKLENSSAKTTMRAIKIIKKGSEQLKQLVRDEKLSIYGSYKLVCALENVPEETRKELEETVTSAVDPPPDEELLKVLKIIGKTDIVKSLLEMTEEKIAKVIEADYKDLYYKLELDPNKVQYNIKVAEGTQVKLKRIHLAGDKLNSEEEAEKFFKKFGGRFIKKAVVEMWIGEVDPYKYKEESE